LNALARPKRGAQRSAEDWVLSHLLAVVSWRDAALVATKDGPRGEHLAYQTRP